jgi:hypothetical protein
MDKETIPVMPDGLSIEEFSQIYQSKLNRHSEELIAEIKSMLSQPVHPDVSEISVEVFPDEYGDGYVSVGMYFEGKNKKVDRQDISFFPGRVLSFAENVRDLPLIDVGSYEDKFSVVDVTVDLVKQWFASCWEKAGGTAYLLPVILDGHEDFGNGKSIKLTSVANR